ncbi:MAG: thiamine phosphate synthase [Candidatus Acidiferrales bacterium]
MFPTLYAVLDDALIASDDPARWVALAETLAESGCRLMQVRAKQSDSRAQLEIATELARSLDSTRVRLIVNDRVDIALLAGAGGVHVGQQDLDVERARAICGPSLWIGVSTHTLDQVRAADRTSADYIAFGPIFPTTTKSKPDALVGLDGLRAARALTRKPLVAIGGITLARARDVYRFGADSLAVASDLLRAQNSGARAEEYLAIAAETIGAPR